MPPRSSTRVFVPGVGEAARTPGTVVSLHKRPGDWVEIEDPLVEVRYGGADAEILAPVSGTLLGFHVSAGSAISAGSPLAEIATDEAEEEAASPSSTAAFFISHAPTLIAIALSALTLVWPAWLAVVLLGAWLVVGVESITLPGASATGREIAAIPFRVLIGSVRWLWRSLLNVGGLLTAVGRLALWLCVAIIGIAGISAVLWVVREGHHGVVAAVRLAELAHV